MITAFVHELPKKFQGFSFRNISTKEVTMYKTDDLGKTVVFFLHFEEVSSPIEFLKLVTLAKDGIAVPKRIVGVPKNSLVHQWSQLANMINAAYKYEATNADIWNKASNVLRDLDTLKDSPVYSFLLEQFQLLITNKYGQRYNKDVLILAAEILNISPAAYRLLRSEAIILPSERLIRKLLSTSFQDNDFRRILEKLKPEQRFVNILFFTR